MVWSAVGAEYRALFEEVAADARESESESAGELVAVGA
jgi:hypothetical protein